MALRLFSYVVAATVRLTVAGDCTATYSETCYGTAPWCGGNQRDCTSNGMVYVKNGCSSGSSCQTGTKVTCKKLVQCCPGDEERFQGQCGKCMPGYYQPFASAAKCKKWPSCPNGKVRTGANEYSKGSCTVGACKLMVDDGTCSASRSSACKFKVTIESRESATETRQERVYQRTEESDFEMDDAAAKQFGLPVSGSGSMSTNMVIKDVSETSITVVSAVTNEFAWYLKPGASFCIYNDASYAGNTANVKCQVAHAYSGTSSGVCKTLAKCPDTYVCGTSPNPSEINAAPKLAIKKLVAMASMFITPWMAFH